MTVIEYLEGVEYSCLNERGMNRLGIEVYEVQTHDWAGSKFETLVGEFIADAINEKIERERNSTKEIHTTDNNTSRFYELS